MTRPTASKLYTSAVLAIALALGSGGLAAAQENVTVTNVTIGKFGTVSQNGVLARVTGTITCDDAGPAEFIEVRVTQQEADATDNFALLDFPCSTEPTPFFATVENLTCEATQDPQDCYHPGAATVTIFRNEDDAVLAQRRVILRYSR